MNLSEFLNKKMFINYTKYFKLNIVNKVDENFIMSDTYNVDQGLLILDQTQFYINESNIDFAKNQIIK